MPVLEVAGLSKVFGRGELAVHALREASFSVQAGELVALLGPSGSGKSTLLLCISLIEMPTAGTITLRGRRVWADGRGEGDTRRYRRENIGFVFQGHNLIPFLTAQENIALALRLNGADSRRAARRAAEMLEYLEIGHRARALPETLSGGERQRVAIGRALANEPPVIFADEPTAALDTERGLKVMELLRRVARQKRSAVIVVTHDRRMVDGFDSAYAMADGRLAPDPGLIPVKRTGDPGSTLDATIREAPWH